MRHDMKEDEWLTTGDPWRLLEALKGASERKRRLLACGCYRRVQHMLGEGPFQAALKLSERFADGRASQEEIEAAVAALSIIEKDVVERNPFSKAAGLCNAATEVLRGNPFTTSSTVAYLLAYESTGPIRGVEWFGYAISDPNWEAAEANEQTRNAVLCRDVLGNPFRPSNIDPAWQTPSALSLAQTIYNQHSFGRLPELADALEKTGCCDADILEHLRGPGPHVKGCWALDLVLGKT